jgi:hypothetical protein
MNLDKLYEILRLTTVPLRKGAEIEERESGGIKVIEIYAMPHESESPTLEKVDLVFLVIGVCKAVAESHKDDLIAILNQWPQPERLASGPSYIEVGGVIGDQGAAFQLFALGQVLGLWKVITPASMGMTGEDARRAAGRGFVMITGYRPTATPSPGA